MYENLEAPTTSFLSFFLRLNFSTMLPIVLLLENVSEVQNILNKVPKACLTLVYIELNGLMHVFKCKQPPPRPRCRIPFGIL